MDEFRKEAIESKYRPGPVRWEYLMVKRQAEKEQKAEHVKRINTEYETFYKFDIERLFD